MLIIKLINIYIIKKFLYNILILSRSRCALVELVEIAGMKSVRNVENVYLLQEMLGEKKKILEIYVK